MLESAGSVARRVVEGFVALGPQAVAEAATLRAMLKDLEDSVQRAVTQLKHASGSIPTGEESEMVDDAIEDLEGALNLLKNQRYKRFQKIRSQG